jgi:riboflavin kinase/FMN adenylyltransferase
MRVVDDLSEPLDGVTATALSIGAYDGVHLGHRAVLSEVCRRAQELGVQSAVVTFDRHPAEVVRPESAPRLLTDLDQKLELLAACGIDLTVVVRFDEDRAAEPADDFVRRVLVDLLRARLVVVGEDFHFGHRRQGNVALLEDMGRDLGFEVLGHHLVGPDGADALDEATVSSTAIRRALVEGRLADANGMLGRPHEMRGPVVGGDKRGRQIGFPTANVAIRPRMLYPADGIYAGRLRRATGEWLPSAVYVGHRPTFYDNEAATMLEVHCLDWTGDLYDEHVAVTFVERIRGDARFDSVEELAAQLRIDCDDAGVALERDEREQNS